MTKERYWPYLVLATGTILGLGFGFFFGLKTQKVENKTFSADPATLTDTVTEKVETKVITKEVPEAYFFQITEERQCPPEYPIKAKFDGTTAIYYTPSNKSYKQVKPHLCFTESSKASARGFLEKK